MIWGAYMNKNKNLYKVIIAASLVVVAVIVSKSNVYAKDICESNYGGGETCYLNKSFSIEKEVRLEGDDSWEDKVHIDLTDKDEKDKYIEFRIRVKNLSSDERDIDFDNMKMEDNLPDELERIGGSGLTEYWDDFEPGETKEFKIRVELDEDILDDDDDFSDCATNKAKLYWDGDFEGSSDASVCWSNEEVSELPKTGASTGLSLLGLALISTGALITKSKKSFN